MSHTKGSEKNWSRYLPLLFAICCAYMCTVDLKETAYEGADRIKWAENRHKLLKY
jgi:hypothetical protein